MTMPKLRPAPDDPEFDALIAELRALARKVERAETRVADLIDERDRLVVKILSNWEVSQERVAERSGLQRGNIARILRRHRQDVSSGSSGPTGRPVTKGAVSNARRRRSK